MQMSVNTLGAVAVSGNAIAQSLEGVVYTGSNAYHQTAVAFVAQNEGGGQRARSILSIKYCCLLGFIVPEIVGVLFTVFGNEISLIYDPTASQAIVAEGMRRILVTFPNFISKFLIICYKSCPINHCMSISSFCTIRDRII